MSSQKNARTEKWIQKEITNILKVKAKNPKFRDITITAVKVSKDLSYATIIWYLYCQDEAAIADLKKELEKVKGLCRKELAQISTSYKVPEIRFKYDTSIEQAERLENILAKIKKN